MGEGKFSQPENGVMPHPSIAIVASIVVPRDAISLAVRHTYFALKQSGFDHVSVFTAKCDYDDMDACEVSDPAQLLTARRFIDADLIIYHFGIHHPLFDALIIGNGRAKQAVFYHNITPGHLVAEANRNVIRRSYVQQFNLVYADRLWPVSQFNAACLHEEGFDAGKIEVIPLVVEKPAWKSPLAKPASPPRILFVGRMVASKGVMDALQAFAALRAIHRDSAFVIAGNIAMSDRDYLETCRGYIAACGMADAVTIVESPDDKALEELYAAAHILLLPTHHEGFCVPVIEALRAGVIPVGYDAGNMPFVCDGLGRLVTTGDVGQLTGRLQDVVADLLAVRLDPIGAKIMLDRGAMSHGDFAQAANEVANRYSFDKVAGLIANRCARLLNLPTQRTENMPQLPRKPDSCADLKPTTPGLPPRVRIDVIDQER